MKSCLYDCSIAHHRERPKQYGFRHRSFLFYLDLDEIDDLIRHVKLFGYNQARPYSLNDRDHIQFNGGAIRQNIRHYLRDQGVRVDDVRIRLLTSVRTFGYVFNPVSFYFCFDEHDRPLCVVPEIGNTFGELKPYFIGTQQWQNGRFKHEQKKQYYVSPFMDLDVMMRFNLAVPDDRLNIRIDDVDQEGNTFFWATMTGQRVPLTDQALARYSCLFPFVTLKTIGLIHWHALRLWLKKIPYIEKTNKPEEQQGVYRVWHKDGKPTATPYR